MSKTAVFGAVLRRARSASGRSMGELARHLEVSVPYISEIENGNKPPLAVKHILKAAEFLATPAEELLRAAISDRGRIEMSDIESRPKLRDLCVALLRRQADLTDEQLEGMLKALQEKPHGEA